MNNPDTYPLIQQLIDNRSLLMLFTGFLVFVGFAFRPGSRATHRDAAQSIFRHDEMHPAAGAQDTAQDTSKPEGGA